MELIAALKKNLTEITKKLLFIVVLLTCIGQCLAASSVRTIGHSFNTGRGNHTITLTPIATPTIIVTAVKGGISACVGSASIAPHLQHFIVSGSNLTGNITLTAPANFEISQVAASGYGSSLTLSPIGSTISNSAIYVRSAATAPVGTITGNVTITSAGAASKNVAVNGNVNPLPTVNAVADQTVVNGSPVTAVNFTGTANTFNWTNDTPSIGLAASGSGNIASFTAINNGTTPITATIQVTPLSSGFAYISNFFDGTVSVINTTTQQVISTINVGPGPAGVAVSPDGSLVYVTYSNSNTLGVINAVTNTKLPGIPVGNIPNGVGISPDGSRVYVTNYDDNTVSVINTTGNTVIATIPVGQNPTGVMVSPDGNRVYTANNTSNDVTVIDAATNMVIATIPAGSAANCVAVSADSKTIYVTNYAGNSVSVINATAKTLITTVTVGQRPVGIFVNPASSSVYVANSFTNTVSVINAVSNTIAATITVGANPYGLSTNPDGSLLYVANSGSNDVSVVNTSTNGVIATVNVGGDPSPLGNFVTGGSGCTGTPITFHITVKPTPPTIATTGTLSGLTTTYGTASSSTNFNVSGINLPAGILVTPPAGFEVSTDNFTFSSTVTIGSGGNIPSTPVYIRLSSATAAGNYSGNIALTSSGAPSVNVAMPNSTVSPAPLTITASSTSKTYGIAITGGPGSTAFNITAGGLQNGNTIGSITVAYGAGSAATDAVGTYTGSVTPSAIVGGSGFLLSNYTVTYAPGDIIVGAAALTVRAANVNKTYGTLLTGGAGSTAFTTTGLQNGESIGSITVTYGAGSAITDPVGTYTGSAVSSAAAGGTFTAGNYSITYFPGDIIVGAAPLTITANNVNKTYGAVLTGGAASIAFGVSGLQNGESVGSVTIAYGTGAAPTDPVGTYAGSVTASSATGGTFNPGNYTITYLPGDILVETAVLTITANGVSKPYGTTLTSGAGFTDFTTGGLQNGETVGSVTVVYGAGSAASDIPGTYAGSVTISAATGGTFAAANYLVVYVRGDIVIPQPSPAITATPTLSGLSTTYGTPSASESFGLSGLGLTAAVLVAAPTGFEVSTDDINYSTTTTIPSGGLITTATVYVRLAATAPVTSYSGNVALTSTGATEVDVAIPNSTVAPALLTIIADDQSRTYGTPNPTLTATYVGFVNGEDPSVLTTPAIISTTADITSQVGQYPIMVSGASSPNYTITPLDGTLTITPEASEIAVPNAFTPNGDGINDTWNIKYLNYFSACSVDIFTRTGVKIFSSIGYGTAWDGTYRGSVLPTGTYYYIINLHNGKNKPLSGYVAILR